MAEYWDLFDENRNPLARTHKRGNELAQGEYHVVVEIWTVNSKKEILVTLRDSRKEDYPDKWENTGGSVLTGEGSRQGAIRELREETGITSTEDELVFLGTYTEHTAFVDIYLLRRDIGLEDLTLQEGETVDAKWISIDELYKIIDNEDLALPTGKRFRHIKDVFLANYNNGE